MNFESVITPKMLIIDNYDSFVYNLYQYFGELGAMPTVYRNDRITINEIKTIAPKQIVLSPGPCHPANKKDFGICSEILTQINDIPILGICLGHQGIIHHFGGEIIKNKPMHGKISEIRHDVSRLFENVKNPLQGMRYHSLVGIDIPDCLEVTAKTNDGVVMAIQHKELPIYGLQFHPESIMTEEGKKIMKNFLKFGMTTGCKDG